MLAGLEAVFTEVKVVTVSALEPGAVDGEHLAAVTPVDAATRACKINETSFHYVTTAGSEEWRATVRVDISEPDSRVNAGHQFHFRQEAGPVRLLREVDYHVLPIGTES